MIETIEFDGIQYAIIIRSDFREPGIHFFTPDEFSQQLAYMCRPQGYRIQPHFHRVTPREISLTQEVLLVKRGSLRVDFYDKGQLKAGSSILNSGDVILLSDGGHGFEMLEECEIIEVKQGPYSGDQDKVRFST
jgi:hypothetical protein